MLSVSPMLLLFFHVLCIFQIIIIFSFSIIRASVSLLFLLSI